MPHSNIQSQAYSGRRLTRKELSREDAYVTISPKQSAIVDLTGVLGLGFWLEREFDPNTRWCVPRPRILALPDDRQVELDFWTCTQDGTESFWVVVSKDDIQSGSGGIVPRDVQIWDRAAQHAGITLQFIFEHELERRAQRIANFLRLLPHVQAGRRNLRIPLIGERVLDLYGAGIDGLTFRQLETGLREFDAADTRMAACVLIHSGDLRFDQDSPLTWATALRRRSAA